ncbi:heavy metal translocating P-type ATPase [Bacillus weihaiensis]|uniref:Cd(2+)-exporting ATPase n=1 Tax=Bacillus weihaiensis TaxID=1547283 RepID=A0A1L3MUU5_9BACI|nr:heavy metal translocating P-type ATPase [Bacillus weihaiensis]APH06125.1 ATPase [Bacillus weihaiensis]
MSDTCCSTENLQTGPKKDTCCSSKEETKAAPASACCSSNQENRIPVKVEKKSTCCSNEPTGTTEKFSYRISGMDCPSCALTIEKGLSGMYEVEAVKVHYNSAKLDVTMKDSSAIDRMEKEVGKLGFSIEPLPKNKKAKTYVIEGMDCGSCAKSIENHLNTISKVQNVSVNFSTGKMKIEHENSVEEIISEVSKIGFKASLEEKNKENTVTAKKENSYIITSGVLILLGFVGSYGDVTPLLTTIMYAAAMVMSGFKPVKSAFYALKSRSLDMNVLMSAAAIGAALIGEWLEGATVVWLFSLGTYLQNRSIEKTRNSIRSLMDLAPSEAWVKQGTQVVKKPVEEIGINDILVVKPGEKIPLDGEVLQGESSVNQAPITGESIPVDKLIGDLVYAGTINESGSLEIKVTKLVEDTTIAKIIHLVEEAQEQKAPTQAFVDRFAEIYTPIVFILALAVMILPPLVGFGTLDEWLYKGLELLVIACPCALVISTPVAIVSAIGNAAKNGILIKGGTFLEKAGSLDAIAFDKTGTLTEGKPKVTSVKTYKIPERELLSIALTLEEYSSHPIAKTIVEYATNLKISSKQGEMFKSIVGKGVQATINKEVFYAGNKRLFEELNISLKRYEYELQNLQSDGKTVVIIGTSKEILGVIAVADTIRPTTVKALKGLKQVGVNQIVMLTGDNNGTAERIATEANVSRYFAELLPEDKVEAIKQLQKEGYTVAMVGDGINDAPALATSDLGIAMGGAGTDTAMETADIVLMADNLEKLPHTVKLSRKALTIIKQNIWFSLIIKLIALVLIFPGWLTLWMAVLSDTGAALLVILNALRLLRVK